MRPVEAREMEGRYTGVDVIELRCCRWQQKNNQPDTAHILKSYIKTTLD